MTLHPEWKVILKGAWSIRLWAVAILLQGGELLLPFYEGDVPRGFFAIGSLLAMVGGMYSRFVLQPKLVKK